MNTPNPFNGNRSFQSPFITYDQWRVAGAYYLGKKPPSQQRPTVATSP